MSTRRAAALLLPLSILARLPAEAAAKPRIADPYVFTDETARISAEGVEGPLACHTALITPAGFGPKRTETVSVSNGAFRLAPLAEGLHVVHLGAPLDTEVRFLAFAPPAALDPAAVARTLPRSGAKLLAGEPFRILAMGDSVTDTGSYHELLARLLARATGNARIEVVRHAYAGRSIDATVRHFDRDTRGPAPDLGLLMYGLNDQVCFVPRRAFLEQYAWVAEQLHDRFGADTVFLQPTPHIDMLRSGREGGSEPPEYAFRTVHYARAIEELGKATDIPVAPTFAAIWGEGGNTARESAMALWPLYPTGYAAPFSTLLESVGRGDTIHPNALGHLQLAKAVYRTIAGRADLPPLALSGTSRWTPTGVVSRITVMNQGSDKREGRLDPYAPMGARIEGPATVRYALAPGETLTFEVGWPDAATPEDLLRFPNDLYLSQEHVPLGVVDFARGRSTVHGVVCPFEVDGDFVPCRAVVETDSVDVELRTPDGIVQETVRLPEEAVVGRVPLVRELRHGSREGHAVAELAFARVGLAPVGEAVVDGMLGEWGDQPAVPVGEPCQARDWRGPADRRAVPGEARGEFLFRAGGDGIYVGFRGQGVLTNDSIMVFLDPREPTQLGTVGPYYWASLGLGKNGKVGVGKGETSPTGEGATGTWRATETGLEAECFLPYRLMDRDAWPASGDLGLSIIWRHRHADGRTTRLVWTEDGHEWNPRWYGVVQRIDPGAAPRNRYVVRVK